jgi:hypothetical protein
MTRAWTTEGAVAPREKYYLSIILLRIHEFVKFSYLSCVL